MLLEVVGLILVNTEVIEGLRCTPLTTGNVILREVTGISSTCLVALTNVFTELGSSSNGGRSRNSNITDISVRRASEDGRRESLGLVLGDARRRNSSTETPLTVTLRSGLTLNDFSVLGALTLRLDIETRANDGAITSNQSGDGEESSNKEMTRHT